MMTISSPAGRRLAKAKAKLDEIEASGAFTVPPRGAHFIAECEFNAAAHLVADELMESGFHEMDGED